jgi:hypothetical protein
MLMVIQRQAAALRLELVVRVPQPFRVAAPQSVLVVARLLQVPAPRRLLPMDSVAQVAAFRRSAVRRPTAEA